MRTELAAALRSRNNSGIELAHKKIHATSHEYAQIIRNLKDISSIDTLLGQTIDQGLGVLTRSGMINAHLTHSGIDTTRAEELVMKGKNQILAVRSLSHTRDVAGTRTSLLEFSNTLIALRNIYRGILLEANLPDSTAQGVLSVARSLDLTKAQIGPL